MTRNEAKEQLEAIIDRHGLKATIDLLAVICGDKAEHIRSNWQDETTAKTWERDMMLLDKLQLKLR